MHATSSQQSLRDIKGPGTSSSGSAHQASDEWLPTEVGTTAEVERFLWGGPLRLPGTPYRLSSWRR